MSGSSTLAAKARQEQGKRAARRMRDDGQVPGIMYGHKQDPVMLALDERELRMLIRHGAHGLIDVNCDGKVESAVIKDLQWDSLGKHILHVDFARVSRGERVVVDVEVVLKGTAPGVSEGGKLDFQLHSVEVECPAESIIESLPVNIGDLHLNKAILVKDLVLPAGLVVKNDPDLVVVHVTLRAEEEEEGAVEGGAVEPELIRPAKPKDEGEE